MYFFVQAVSLCNIENDFEFEDFCLLPENKYEGKREVRKNNDLWKSLWNVTLWTKMLCLRNAVAGEINVWVKTNMENATL